LLAFAILCPVAAYALAVGVIDADNIIKGHQRKVADYSNGQNKKLPEIVECKYGMALNIAQVAILSPAPERAKLCRS
jgi:hypothetical protein